MTPTDIRTQLHRLSDEALKHANQAPSHDGSKRRWEILSDKLEEVAGLKVLDNLINGGPCQNIHEGGTRE